MADANAFFADVFALDDRPDAAAAIAARSRRTSRRGDLRESRVPESRRVGEGSRREGDSRGRRGARSAAPGLNHPRRDVRQHRHRLRDDRGGARISAEAVRPRERDTRAAADPAGLWRRGRADERDGGERRCDPRGTTNPRRGSRALLLRRPVQQRRQLAGALRHDGAGNHRADGRSRDALRRGARHQRHVRGHWPPTAGAPR